jgi:hypothetical protein
MISYTVESGDTCNVYLGFDKGWTNVGVDQHLIIISEEGFPSLWRMEDGVDAYKSLRQYYKDSFGWNIDTMFSKLFKQF